MQLSSPGTYTITNTIAASGGCTAATYSATITIIPTPPIPTINNVSICAGNSATLIIADTGGSYQWFDAASGGTMVGTGSTLITPVLSSTTRYYVQAINGACPSPRKEVLVTVYPIPTAPVVVSNSPVCMGNPLVLGAGYVPGAVYTWKGPNNFSSNLQNPFINSATLANSGTYSLFITVNGCSSSLTTVDVKVNVLPVVTAGPDRTVCISSNSVSLSGNVSGLSSSAIWSSSGTGVFSPSNTSLNATYIPSSADKANLKVVLTLTSLNNQSCAPAVSSMTVNFVPLPVVNAGVNQVICADVADISLSGLVSGATGGTWTTTGDGSFSSSNSLKATYKPGAADIKNKAVTLTLTSTGNVSCVVKDDLLVTINPLPAVSAGKDRTILQDQTVTLEGTSSAAQVQYIWSPAVGLSNYTARNPVFSGTSTQTYTLTITNEWGCVASDDVTITVLEPIKIPNTFTPNGDGVNDVWNIAKLKDYPDAEVHVYNRYGVKLFYSKGYDEPWDGTFKGVKVPFGTYYYLIDTKFPGQIFSGYILVME
jgi:gliding motility-associated-like protein